MIKKVILGVFSVALTAGAFSAQADDAAIARGEINAQTCLGCHGVAGYNNVYPTYQVPRIWGQRADYIVSALKSYQNKDRSHPVMRAQAADWTEAEIKDIAAYFAAGAKVEEPATMPEAIDEVASCGSCHGAAGISKLANNPTLAGQNKSYLLHALKSYRAGIKNAPRYLGGVRAKGKSKTMRIQVEGMLKAVKKEYGEACAEKAKAHHAAHPNPTAEAAEAARCVEAKLTKRFKAIADYYSSLEGLEQLRQ